MYSKDKCVEKIRKLLLLNELKDAFKLLETYLSECGFPIDLTPYVVTVSAQFHRTEKEFRLGTLEWEKYNISNNQIVVRTLALTEDLCLYRSKKEDTDDIHLRHIHPNDLRELLKPQHEELKIIKRIDSRILSLVAKIVELEENGRDL